jgi:para-nitrobenzyl esterase
MKLKIYSVVSALFLLLFCLQCNQSNAQGTTRYLDTVFTAVDTTMNIVYTTTAGGATADTELMDIYQPAGDTAQLRPLIVFVHGGAFFEGSKNDGDQEFLCSRFAQRGYVCATINYRLVGSVLLLYDSAQIFTYIMKAFSDMKASIRYFYKDAAVTNQWKIDTNFIFIGGSSAGAIAADYVGLLDSVNELAPPFQTICNSQGGITGNSGNAGYSTKSIAIASLAGAVDDLRYIKPTSPPMVFCQGTADGTIPYYCGEALTQYGLGTTIPTIRFCGSGEMSPQLDSVGVCNSLMPFPGSGHVPWDTNQLIENRMDSAVAAFFYSVKTSQLSCTSPTGVTTLTSQPQINIFPNPTNSILHINLAGVFELSEIQMYDCTGREVRRQTAGGQQSIISTEGLAQGVYLLRIDLKGANADPITQRVVIE